jgi:hypothetical protein
MGRGVAPRAVSRPAGVLGGALYGLLMASTLTPNGVARRLSRLW